MPQLSQFATTNLLRLKQSKLTKGQIFLLAKALSDIIPLPPADIDSIDIYTLSYRKTIDHALYGLSEYTYADQETKTIIYALINSIMLWRFNVAYTGITLFVGDEASDVIANVSGLTRYVDEVYLLAVGDILPTANWLFATFKELASWAKEIESPAVEVN